MRRGTHREISDPVRQGSELMTLRRTPYRSLKRRRDKSMVIKRKMSEDVYGIVLQRLSDMAKAILPESQSPEVDLTPVGNTPVIRRCRQARIKFLSALRSGRQAMRSERIQGDEREAYVALLRFSMTEHGMAYGARALGSRSRRSSRGSYAPPRHAGRPRTGRRVAGHQMVRDR